MRRFGLRDDQWERIKNLLPGREGSVGVTLTPTTSVREGRRASPASDILKPRFARFPDLLGRFSLIGAVARK